MPNGNNNGNIWKYGAAAGACLIIGGLFYYFITAHFNFLQTHTNQINSAIDKNTQVLTNMNQELNDLEAAISKLNWILGFEEYTPQGPSPYVEKFYPVETEP